MLTNFVYELFCYINSGCFIVSFLLYLRVEYQQRINKINSGNWWMSEMMIVFSWLCMGIAMTIVEFVFDFYGMMGIVVLGSLLLFGILWIRHYHNN